MDPISADSQLAEVRSDMAQARKVAELRHYNFEGFSEHERYNEYEKVILEIQSRYRQAKEAVEKLDNPTARQTTLDALEKQEKEEEGGKDEKYLRRECRVSCQRSYYVGDQVEEDSVKAKYENGMLQLVVPKEEPKKIAAKSIAIE